MNGANVGRMMGPMAQMGQAQNVAGPPVGAPSSPPVGQTQKLQEGATQAASNVDNFAKTMDGSFKKAQKLGPMGLQFWALEMTNRGVSQEQIMAYIQQKAQEEGLKPQNTQQQAMAAGGAGGPGGPGNPASKSPTGPMGQGSFRDRRTPPV
jgi:hypothetical protein